EMGKIAAEAPTRSREIRTGAFGTVHAGQIVFVESTAAGAAGDFFDLVQEADAVRRLGRPLSPHEFKLIFLPWQLRQQYRAGPATVLITKELADYFADLEHNHVIRLDAEQRAWYAVTQKKIGPDSMLKEYPSYPEEAFKVSIEGAYFKPQMTKAREERRIGKVPVDPSRPVNTFLGHRQVRQHRYLVPPEQRANAPHGGLLRKQRRGRRALRPHPARESCRKR